MCVRLLPVGQTIGIYLKQRLLRVHAFTRISFHSVDSKLRFNIKGGLIKSVQLSDAFQGEIFILAASLLVQN